MFAGRSQASLDAEPTTILNSIVGQFELDSPRNGWQRRHGGRRNLVHSHSMRLAFAAEHFSAGVARASESFSGRIAIVAAHSRIVFGHWISVMNAVRA